MLETVKPSKSEPLYFSIPLPPLPEILQFCMVMLVGEPSMNTPFDVVPVMVAWFTLMLELDPVIYTPLWQLVMVRSFRVTSVAPFVSTPDAPVAPVIVKPEIVDCDPVEGMTITGLLGREDPLTVTRPVVVMVKPFLLTTTFSV